MCLGATSRNFSFVFHDCMLYISGILASVLRYVSTIANIRICKFVSFILLKCHDVDKTIFHRYCNHSNKLWIIHCSSNHYFSMRCKRYFIRWLSIQCHITNKHLIFWVRKTNNIPHEKREEKKDFQRYLKMGQTLIEQKVEMGLLVSLPLVCMYFDKVNFLHLLSCEFWSKTNVFVKNSL